jgi:nucleoside-diphosphate-sugar epimerase
MKIAVIGGTGQIGRRLVRLLAGGGRTVAAVSRHGASVPGALAPNTSDPGPASTDRPVPGTVMPIAGDVRRPAELAERLDGCESAIVTLGLPYRSKIWEAQWPGLMAGVVELARLTGWRVTVLDNAYVYGAPTGPLTERTALAPCSAKGAARLRGFEALRTGIEEGLDLTVCRASDYLGPGAETTIVPWTPLLKAARARGKARLSWIGDPATRHAYAWTPDVAAALAQVHDQRPETADGVIHLPATTPFTGNELATALAAATGHRLRLAPLGPRLMRLAAIVAPMAREQADMMYGVDRDYVLDDSLFRAQFPDFPTTTAGGIVARLTGPETEPTGR